MVRVYTQHVTGEFERLDDLDADDILMSEPPSHTRVVRVIEELETDCDIEPNVIEYEV